MLLHVKRARVERELPFPEAWNMELSLWEYSRHEAADWESGHLDSDLGYDQGLSAVGEELVEE